MPNLVLNINWINGNEGRDKRELSVCYKVINEVEAIVSEEEGGRVVRRAYYLCRRLEARAPPGIGVYSSLEIRKATLAHDNISLNELLSSIVRILLK